MECSSFTFYTKYYFHYSIKICIVILGSKLLNREHYSADLPNTIGQIVCFDNLALMTQCNRNAFSKLWHPLDWDCAGTASWEKESRSKTHQIISSANIDNNPFLIKSLINAEDLKVE